MHRGIDGADSSQVSESYTDTDGLPLPNLWSGFMPRGIANYYGEASNNYYFMKSKKEVIKKIISMCNKRNIPIPDFQDKDNVLKTIELINNTCPFCKKYVWHDTWVICSCEIKFNNF